MQISSVHKAKTHLSDLIKRAETGEDVIICKAGRPAVRLVKYEFSNSPRKPGALEGKIRISEDFDDLPKEILAAFNGESE